MTNAVLLNTKLLQMATSWPKAKGNRKCKSCDVWWRHQTSIWVTQQHKIRIDPPNTAVGPKIDANAWRDVVYTMFPGNMDHMMPYPPETWLCTAETGQHCLLLHITWRALDQLQLRNSDRDITIWHGWHGFEQRIITDEWCKVFM